MKSTALIISITCFLLFILYIFFPTTQIQAASSTSTPLSTQNEKIIDAQGNRVLLRGVNWFGFETDTHIPHGLWARDYKSMIAQMKQLGYNTIRLPYSVQALKSSNISSVAYSIGSNNDFNGKTPLQAMDLIIQEAANQGLYVILDNHGLNDNNIPELWYNTSYTEQDWINTWTLLASRYKNQWNVIGADLKNEPHGKASWGTDDVTTDWRLAAGRAGNAILQVNPNWLIVVEGVDGNVKNGQLGADWWGGNLEGARNFPVVLSNIHKLVYSTHEYGPGVYNQPWFSDPTFPQNMPARWEKGFNYLNTEHIAPVFIGEFGGRLVDSISKEGIWQRAFVDFIKKNNLSFTYWSWNPNSGDTGGILNDDWITINTAKQQMLSVLLSSPAPNVTPSPTMKPSPSATSPILAPTATPKPTPTPTPKPGVTPTPAPTTGKVTAAFVINSDVGLRYCGFFDVKNTSNQPISNWKITFQMTQFQMDGSWNGVYKLSAGQFTVTVPNWAQTLSPQQSMGAIGFCAKKTGVNFAPTNVHVE